MTAALAAEALGPDRVFGVAMPGPYSSPGSLTDAEDLARRLGIGRSTLYRKLKELGLEEPAGAEPQEEPKRASG